jgi:hypothetical protein
MSTLVNDFIIRTAIRNMTISTSFDNTSLDFLTVWQIKDPPEQPFRRFLHLVNTCEEIIAQHDGWDIQLKCLADGDVAVQLHQIYTPKDLPAGSYYLRLGVYDIATGQRFAVDAPVETTTLFNCSRHSW